MAPVDGAEHIAAAYAVLRTEAAVEVVVVAAAAVVAAAVEGHVAAQEVGPGAACYGAAPVAVGSKRP